MNLASVMDEIATRLNTITGLRCFAYPPDNIAPPAAITTYPDTYTYDETYGRGMDRMTLPVVVVVGKVSDRKSRDLLSRYCDGDGLTSIKAVIEGEGVPSFLNLPAGGSAGSISTPDRASMPGGSNAAFWLAVDIALDDWTPSAVNSFISSYLALFSLKCVVFDLQTNGRPRLVASSTGANDLSFQSTIAYGFTDGDRHGVGVHVQPAVASVSFYTAADLNGPWTLHEVVSGSSFSLFNSSQPWAVGAGDGGTQNPASGEVYGAEVRIGDVTGTRVAFANLGPQMPGVPAFLDPETSWPWTLSGDAAITAGAGAPAYTAFDSVRVQDADINIFPMAGVDYLAATFNLDIVGEGAS